MVTSSSPLASFLQKLHRLLEVLVRLLEIGPLLVVGDVGRRALAIQEVRVRIRVRRLGRLLDRLLAVLDGLVGELLALIAHDLGVIVQVVPDEHAQRDLGVGILRIGFDALRVPVLGLGELARLRRDDAERVEDLGIASFRSAACNSRRRRRSGWYRRTSAPGTAAALVARLELQEVLERGDRLVGGVVALLCPWGRSDRPRDWRSRG